MNEEILSEISEPISAEVSKHSQSSADNIESYEEGVDLSPSLEDSSNDSQIIQIDSNVEELNLIIDQNEIIIQKLSEIHESLEYVSQNYYNQQIYSREFTEYFFGISVLVLLLIVARLLYKLFNNIFFGGI